MHGRVQRRIAVGIALALLVIPLRADITLPAPPPPQADAVAVRVWRGAATTIPLRGHHGGGAVTFWIVQRPDHGKLSDLRVLGDNRATINYQNDGTESIPTDRFSYVVKTSGDQVSSPAEVSIFVEEPPAKMQVPVRIEFDEIMAGESETRQLTITNEGGGVLEGRLTVSAPWRVAAPDYRVNAGATENIGVAFRPEEARDFVGQITLAGSGGDLTSVLLVGTATSPIVVEPGILQIEVPKGEKDPRTGSVSLTNRTERVLQLKLETSSSIKPIEEVALAPKEKKKIEVVVLSDRTVPVHERIAIVGPGFRARLQIEADAVPLKRIEAPLATATPATRVAVMPRPASPPAQTRAIAAPASTPSQPIQFSGEPFVAARAQRLDSARWEVRWPRPKEQVAKYQIDERILSLNGAGELQTGWRQLPPPEISNAGDEAIAQINGLDPRQLHMLRITALSATGVTLWESPPVALAPPREPPRDGHGWLLVFAIALVAFLVLRWRANRTVA